MQGTVGPGWDQPIASGGRDDRPTDQQLVVLQHLANGLTRQQAARAMDMSLNTVRSHCRRLHTRLGVGTSAHAVAVALRNGWID